ncbi:SPX domain-containing protein 1 [Citrus sinensis]|uniref:SPX domain-containing protein 1 n=2 Tax=Citrus TaxID=2706 RepID=A0ACB8NNE6_CITSI|nr:hypothetical protein CICLE_v10009041mg [Citrus x clementina]KAH9760679.1 SPX domain-containing protein 1 [Citrus sinensis]KAH9799114.1 SPX domain-containing protein 1 [Citrus sinensis]
MKFWKSLSILIEETLPEWRDKFLSYKDLKKQLKLIYPEKQQQQLNCDGGINKRLRIEGPEETDGGDCASSKEDNEEAKQELQDRVAKSKDSNEELMKVGREIVDFHGEMVLLENYSALNYTGLVKILKKYDKRTGALIRLPFIKKVLQQPFYTTDVLNKLVKECEVRLDQLFSMDEPSASSEGTELQGGPDFKASTESKGRPLPGSKELAEIEHMENMYVKLTLSALRVLKEIRSGSSTVSMFSLPPLQSTAVEYDWKKVPVLEQAAK